MSKNVSSADNQQGSRRSGDPSETTRRAPLIKAYLLGKHYTMEHSAVIKDFGFRKLVPIGLESCKDFLES